MSKESKSVRFLYNTKSGRACLKLLVHPFVSNTARVYLNSPLSKPIIKSFVKKNNIDLDEYEDKKFSSFNKFFIRNKKEVEFDSDINSFISPCDGYLSVYEINDNSVFNIKNTNYDLKSLLEDETLADEFKGGHCFIFRLMPHHFHRYMFTDNGVIKSFKSIKGVLHCVRPVACRRYPVYVQNQRTYAEIETENFGKIIQMEVGAIIVGRIKNHKTDPFVLRGQEKGYFEFGGSTIIILTKKGAVKVDEKFIANTNNGIETDIKIGEKVGEK